MEGGDDTLVPPPVVVQRVTALAAGDGVEPAAGRRRLGVGLAAGAVAAASQLAASYVSYATEAAVVGQGEAAASWVGAGVGAQQWWQRQLPRQRRRQRASPPRQR